MTAMQKKSGMIILSLFLLNFFSWVFWGESVYGFPSVVKYLLSSSVLFIILYYRLINPFRPGLGNFYNQGLIFFFVWSVILLIAVILNPQSELWPTLSFPQRVFGQPNFFLPYVFPIFVLYSKFSIDFFITLIKYASILLFLGVLLEIYTLFSGVSIADKEQQSRVLLFDLGSSFLLLTSHLSKKKYIFHTALFYLLLRIILLAQWGRRAMFLDALLVIAAMVITRLRTVYLTFNDRMKIYFSGFILAFMFLSVSHIISSTYIFQRGFTQKAQEETRGFVYEAFFQDLDTAPEYLFGRGIGGTIVRDVDTGRIVDFVESGFLILLFKGGLLYLIPFLIILLRAFYLGFFKSNNYIAKALAILILIYMISMYGWNWPDLSARYLFLWISVSGCYNTELRSINNENIFTLINTEKRKRLRSTRKV